MINASPPRWMVSKNRAKGLKSSEFRSLNSFNCLVVAAMICLDTEETDTPKA